MMNGLKKAILASAIAAIGMPAFAEIRPLADQDLQSITGQAGVTIELQPQVTTGTTLGQAGVTVELQTQVAIGEFRYTDEGTFGVGGIRLEGYNYGDLLDDVMLTIDIAPDGDAIIHVGSVSGSAIDFGVRFDYAYLEGRPGSAAATGNPGSTVTTGSQGNPATPANPGSAGNPGAPDSTLLMSNFDMRGYLGGMWIQVDTETDNLFVRADFLVDDLDVDVDFLAVGIRDMQIFDDKDPAGTGDNYVVFEAAMAGVANTRSSGGSALAVAIPRFEADMNIGAIEMGGTSIGSVALQDMVISNTRLEIYGH